jgi:hypothetical protein
MEQGLWLVHRRANRGAAPAEQMARPTVLEQRTPCLAVLAYDRPHRLAALLDSLNQLDYGASAGHVVLRIHVDVPANALGPWAARNKTLDIARDFADGSRFVAGRVEVHARERHGGMMRAWLDAWDPVRHPHPACALLEEDVLPSRYAWQWTLGALKMYRPFLPRLGALSWQRQTLVASLAAGGGRMPPAVPGPFLYRLLGTWGFVALADSWGCFRRWVDRWERLSSMPPPVRHNGTLIVPEVWAQTKAHTGRMWSHWWLRYSADRGLLTLYANLASGPDGQPRTLCSNTRVAGRNHGNAQPSPDFPVLEEAVGHRLSDFPAWDSLIAYNWNAQEMDRGEVASCHASGPAGPAEVPTDAAPAAHAAASHRSSAVSPTDWVHGWLDVTR